MNRFIESSLHGNFVTLFDNRQPTQNGNLEYLIISIFLYFINSSQYLCQALSLCYPLIWAGLLNGGCNYKLYCLLMCGVFIYYIPTVILF